MGAEPGIYVEFESQPGFGLKLESLDASGSGIELVSVVENGSVEKATVFVPDGKIKHFIKRFEQYAAEFTKKGIRKHKELVEGIAELRLATLRALWTDVASEYPAEAETIWWEVWLRDHDGNEESRLSAFAEETGLVVGTSRLKFPDRTVVLIKATAAQLSLSLDVLNDLGEVRRAKQVADDFLTMKSSEAAEWVTDLVDRLDVLRDPASSVCVLDTGVNRGHPLLSGSLATADLHSWQPAWGVADHHGHGTEMAGLALVGDLAEALTSAARVKLRHGLESVKILPPAGSNPPELYGAITAEAAARVEIQAPNRRRAFSMSVTTGEGRDQGRPSSWSAAVDAIAAGRSFDSSRTGLVYLDTPGDGPRRLFIISAGNVDTTDLDHLARCDLQSIHDPAQAWNALTVGACTHLDKIDPNDKNLSGFSPVARAGDLSPYSSTSVPFAKQWPLKPDVVFEGGNKLHDGKQAWQHDSVSVLTTHHKHHERLLTTSYATSAATAQVARIAGAISADYPNLWPEAIRALIVHSAEWTPRMEDYVRNTDKRMHTERLLVRRFGFGIPSLERASRSAQNALTLIVQDSMRPFEAGKLCEMKVHELPWPTDELASLGDAVVRMRVTLSYFVEPNPARRGWRNRHQYASHGLRFDVMRPTETPSEFRKRVNKLQLDEGEKKPAVETDTEEWRLGTILRHHGSLHSDMWKGTAADLARRGAIGLYPVTGWWKEQPSRDRSAHGARYALIVSIETDDTEVDIYTPVAQMVGISASPIVIET